MSSGFELITDGVSRTGLRQRSAYELEFGEGIQSGVDEATEILLSESGESLVATEYLNAFRGLSAFNVVGVMGLLPIEVLVNIAGTNTILESLQLRSRE